MANSSARSVGEEGEALSDSKGVRWERALFIKERVLRVGRRRLRVSSAVSSGMFMLMGPHAKGAEVVGTLWLGIFDGGGGGAVDYQGVKGRGGVNGAEWGGYGLSSLGLGIYLMMDS